jgi:hypothetical protein
VEHRRVCSSPTKHDLIAGDIRAFFILAKSAQAIACAGQSSRATAKLLTRDEARRVSANIVKPCRMISRSNPDELVSRLNVLQSRLKIFKGRRGAAPSFLRSTVPCKPLRRVVPVGSAHHPRHHGYDRHGSGAVAASGIRGRDHMTFVERRPPANRCPTRGKSSAHGLKGKSVASLRKGTRRARNTAV